MITKREILKHIIETKGLCEIDNCRECPYWEFSFCRKLKVIGAMAILRMFPENKKPTFAVGTVIKFADGKIAEICELNGVYYLAFGGYRKSIEYLVGRIWEVVEE